ncbi:MAG: hypothetical protein E6Q27_01275 [Aeromicrobium sp.]|nr:MAG: hypothetical protein E6Q27_01275 [Aeromicrobium sp.]
MNEDSHVGSLAEETMRLFAALGTSTVQGDASGHEGANCPHGWCPVCKIFEFVTSNPAVVDEASEALAKVTGAVMELIKVLHPDMTHE